jgi:CopG family nickel-responsive transcriptional regulator
MPDTLSVRQGRKGHGGWFLGRAVESTLARMRNELVRFGVAMERPLLEHFDRIVADRGVTRSEVLRDLVRAEVVRAQVAKGAPSVATLTLVYDHHVRELTERLTEFQHQLGDRVRSTLHIHLDEHRCLEVVVMRGRSDELKRVADRLLATRGVTHGGIEIIADDAPEAGRSSAPGHARAQAHAHPHAHPHPQEHEAGHTHRKARRARPTG